MDTIIHKAESRGKADHGWLNSRHTFSFAEYYDPSRIHFGVLRVLNDDTVAEGRGFGMHPHNNMEIISIPLEGDLEHRDSMGNKKVICEGEIQVMSAGTGVMHSEYNRNMDRPVKFLQIWLFPNQKNVEPRYDQQSINFLKKKNAFYQILSPNPTEQGVWIHQDAWFSMGDFEQGVEVIYPIHKKGNGIYLFVIEGSCEVAGVLLDRRDGFGAWNTESIPFKATGSCRVLLMEVPMAQQQ